MGQYRGTIKTYNEEQGFGFIECAMTYARFQRDVFVHKSRIGGVPVGTEVMFTLEISKQGMPQARDLTSLGGFGVAGGSKGGGKGKGGKGNKGKGKGNKGKGKGR